MDTFVSVILFSAKYLTVFGEFCLYIILLPLTPLIKLIWNIVTRRLDIHHDPDNNNRRPWELQILNWKFHALAISHGMVGIMEAWLNGWCEVEDFEAFLSKLALRPKLMLKLVTMEAGFFTGFYNIRWNWFNIQTKERAKLYCKLSYNLGRDFFATFLDTYSCLFSVAYYGAGATNLEEAQRHKMELTVKNMKLKPGMRVLDLGCGFGGFSHFLATEYGVSVLAVTNCSEMAAATRELCAGLDVQVQEADWRDLTDENNSFDRVVGIEVLFHVGRHNVDPFFKQISKWLKPEGICIIQDFATRPGMVHGFSFVHEYFFPGSYILRLDQILGVSEKYFCLEKFTDLTPDMERTCADALKRLVNNWPQVENKYEKKYFKLYQLLFAGGVVMARSGFFGAEQFVFRKLPAPFPL